MKGGFILKSRIVFSVVSALITLVSAFSAPATNAIKGEPSFPYTSTVSHSTKNYEFSDLKNLKIETDRLIITQTDEGDLDKLSEYLLDKEVTKYLDPTLKDGFETKEQALSFLKTKGSDEFDYTLEFTVKLKDRNAPIGKLDLSLFKLGSSSYSGVYVGYWLGKEYQGKKYMSEAAVALCNEAFNALDVQALYIVCDPENAKSIGLAEKIFDSIEKINSNARLYSKKFEDSGIAQLFLSKFKMFDE